MFDLIIRGGKVVTSSGVGNWDVAVQGERIAALAASGTIPDDAGPAIDATGKIVVPGGIEPHAHVAAPMPTQRREVGSVVDVTRAAIFGGTTTVLDFAHHAEGPDIFRTIEGREARWKADTYTDYSYHCMLTGDIALGAIAQIKDVVGSGVPSFKMFTTNVRPPTSMRLEQGTTFGHIAEVLGELAEHGGISVIHAEDDDLVQFSYKKYQELGLTDWSYVHELHSNLSEDLSFRRVTRLAQAKGAGVYFVHVTAREGVDAIAEARAQGQPVYGEVLHNYLAFNADIYDMPDGMQYHTYPGLKSEEDRQRLWQGLLDGTLSTVATDEFSTTKESKLLGRNIRDVVGGHNGIETRLGIVYTEGVVKRGMSLQRFVDVTSANAAKILGFWPRKGTIAVGSDADLCIIDPSIRKVLTMADLHISDYSIWEGWEVQGWPVVTVLRGKVVVENGRLLGKPGDGQLIPRKIDSSVLARPVC